MSKRFYVIIVKFPSDNFWVEALREEKEKRKKNRLKSSIS